VNQQGQRPNIGPMVTAKIKILPFPSRLLSLGNNPNGHPNDRGARNEFSTILGHGDPHYLPRKLSLKNKTTFKFLFAYVLTPYLLFCKIWL
jgi:hypothetical protein